MALSWRRVRRERDPRWTLDRIGQVLRCRRTISGTWGLAHRAARGPPGNRAPTGRAAYVTSDGQQTILYFSTGTYTVMVTRGGPE